MDQWVVCSSLALADFREPLFSLDGGASPAVWLRWGTSSNAIAQLDRFALREDLRVCVPQGGGKLCHLVGGPDEQGRC